MKLRIEALLVHGCTACVLGFSIGPALGGHMRRHHGGGAASTTTTQEEEEEEDCGGSGDVYAVDLARAVMLHERPGRWPPCSGSTYSFNKIKSI